MERPSGYDVRRALRRPTARWRKLPDFLIIGAQKAGTTSLHNYLEQGSGVLPALTKEIHFFDHHYADGEGWYRAHFPLSSVTGVTGEASPFYLLHPLAPRRATSMVPTARIIVVLRDPIQRAYSHFNHSRAYRRESLDDFSAALDAEPERTEAAWQEVGLSGERQEALDWFTYVRRSLYMPQLRRWLDYISPEQLHVVLAEELFADPHATLRRVREHLALPAVSSTPVEFSRLNARSYPDMSKPAMDRLRSTFGDDVAELEELLGRSTGWLTGR